MFLLLLLGSEVGVAARNESGHPAAAAATRRCCCAFCEPGRWGEMNQKAFVEPMREIAQAGFSLGMLSAGLGMMSVSKCKCPDGTTTHGDRCCQWCDSSTSLLNGYELGNESD